MSALAAYRRATPLRPGGSKTARLARSIIILYWAAGLLLIVPLAFGCWAVSTALRAAFRRR